MLVGALILGASRLPQLGDALGRSIRNFKKGIKGENEIDVTPEPDKLPPPEEKETTSEEK